MKWILTFALFWSIGLMGFASGRKTEEVRPGDTLPTFTIQTNTGEMISSASLKGKPAIIIFFHTHCYDCRKELPVLQKIYEEYGRQMEFLAISRAQPASEIEEFWKSNHLNMPYIAQEDKSIFQLFAQKTIPRIYVCGADGIIEKVFVEKVGKRRLERTIRRLLNSEK